MMKSAPINAIIVVIISTLDGTYLSNGMEIKIAKKGESLLSIFASAIPNLSIA